MRFSTADQHTVDCCRLALITGKEMHQMLLTDDGPVMVTGLVQSVSEHRLGEPKRWTIKIIEA